MFAIGDTKTLRELQVTPEGQDMVLCTNYDDVQDFITDISASISHLSGHDVEDTSGILSRYQDGEITEAWVTCYCNPWDLHVPYVRVV